MITYDTEPLRRQTEATTTNQETALMRTNTRSFQNFTKRFLPVLALGAALFLPVLAQATCVSGCGGGGGGGQQPQSSVIGITGVAVAGNHGGGWASGSATGANRDTGAFVDTSGRSRANMTTEMTGTTDFCSGGCGNNRGSYTGRAQAEHDTMSGAFAESRGPNGSTANANAGGDAAAMTGLGVRIQGQGGRRGNNGH